MSANPHPQSTLRRILRLQESGLVLVIIFIGALLAYLGGNKPKPEKIELAADAVIQETGPIIVITTRGRGHSYSAAEGWTLREGSDSRPRALIRDYVEFIRLPASTTIETQKVKHGDSEDDAVYIVNNHRYVIADGWELSRTDTEVLLQRKRMVNKFLEIGNLILLVKDASFIAIMAVGMTAVIVMAGIDLSVGSVYALAALIGALALRALQSHYAPGTAGAPWYLTIPIGVGLCCLIGAACGTANGILIVGLRVHPFIITLGTMVALRGLVVVLTKGLSVSGIPDSFMEGFFKAEWKLGGTQLYPVPVIFMIAVALIGHFVLTRMLLGRRTYAIGGNETASYYAGIPVGRVKVVVHTLCGMLAGLSAAVYVGYFGSASPDAGSGYELQVVAASVIGGASLSGGRGTALGAVLGAILIMLINNALIILEIDSNYTNIVMGIAIILAVVLDQLKARFSPCAR